MKTRIQVATAIGISLVLAMSTAANADDVEDWTTYWPYPYGQSAAEQYPHSAVGWLISYWQEDGGFHGLKKPCTASVVSSPSKSTLLTAAHCVLDDEGNFPVAIYFVPGAHPDGGDLFSYLSSGSFPYGIWTFEEVGVSGGYRNHDKGGLDFAFVRLAPNNQGELIEDVTGSLGIQFNQSRDEHLSSLGYPNTTP